MEPWMVRIMSPAVHDVSFAFEFIRDLGFSRLAARTSADGRDRTPDRGARSREPVRGSERPGGEDEQRAYAEAARLTGPTGKSMEIPCGGSTVPGCVYKVDGTARTLPAVIVHGGFDAGVEELFISAPPRRSGAATTA